MFSPSSTRFVRTAMGEWRRRVIFDRSQRRMFTAFAAIRFLLKYPFCQVLPTVWGASMTPGEPCGMRGQSWAGAGTPWARQLGGPLLKAGPPRATEPARQAPRAGVCQLRSALGVPALLWGFWASGLVCLHWSNSSHLQTI